MYKCVTVMITHNVIMEKSFFFKLLKSSYRIETTFPAMEEIYKNTLVDIITKIKKEVSAPYQIEKRKNYLKKQLMENIKVEETYQQYINRTNKIKYMLQENYQSNK